MSTAAALIIGDAILSGKFEDQNTPWLIQRCRQLGIDLKGICIIPDIREDIAFEVRRWSRRVDFVYTTGGVGPTHDDLTMPAIAHAFSVPLERHPRLEEIIRERFDGRLNEDILRMADLPQGATLYEEEDLYFPQVAMNNVFIFPGVPRLFQKKFNAVAHHFSGTIRHLRRLVTEQPETTIASTLRQIADTHTAVDIGSYPQFDTKPYTVTITLDGRDLNAIAEAEAELRERLEIISA